MSVRLASSIAMLGCGCGSGADTAPQDPEGSDPTESSTLAAQCTDAGADIVLAGVVVPSLDTCQISAVPPYGEIVSYVDNLQLAGIGQGYREQCVGVDDGLGYQRVVQQYDLTSGAWSQTDAIFDADGYMEWEAESERSTECDGRPECPNCCATYCCSGIPTSGLGSGRPHELNQCVRVEEWQAP